MLISVHKKFVFIANTKSASTSIEHMLADHCEIMRPGSSAQKHKPLHRIRGEYWFLFDRPGHDFDSYFRFGVMRDPIDWITSWFRYRKGNQVESPLPAAMTFADFWAAKDWNILRADGSRYLQGDLFRVPGHPAQRGNIMADVIIPYHQLTPLLPDICAALGVAAPLPRRNESLMRRLDETLSPELEAEMRAFYAADYEILDILDKINSRGMAKLQARTGSAPA